VHFRGRLIHGEESIFPIFLNRMLDLLTSSLLGSVQPMDKSLNLPFPPGRLPFQPIYPCEKMKRFTDRKRKVPPLPNGGYL
jgi:hypothetical protein